MAPTARLPLIPPGAHEVTDSLAILRDSERVVFSNAGGPIFSCRNSDRMGLRLAAVNAVATPAPATLVGPRERAAEDQSCQAGVAVKRTLEVRRLVGPKRRVTVAFDREGWSPKRFAHLQDEGFDVLTYRKGKQSRWRETSFEQVRGVVGGERVEYRLAERQVTLQGGLRVREIRA